MIDGLRAKYQEAGHRFDQFVKEAEKNKDEIAGDLTDLNNRIKEKSEENDNLLRESGENDSKIRGLTNDIDGINREIDQIKVTNEGMLRDLESSRVENERTIDDLQRKQADTQLELNKLKLLIQKQQNELDFINTESQKFSAQSYADKVHRFRDYIDDSNRKTEQMQRELDQLKYDFDSKLQHASRRAEQLLQANERGGKLEELTMELRDKEGQLAALERQRHDLERAINSDDHATRDRQIQAL